MDVEGMIRLLVELGADGEAAFAQGHGDAALATAREIEAVLMEQFERRLSYVVLWEQFLQTPHEVADAVAGVVRARVAEDAALAEWLREAWARYQAQADDGGGR